MAGRIAYTGGIVRDGLVLDLDAAKRDSYPGSGTVWRDIAGSTATGSLINGPIFNTANGGNIIFDGTNDYCDIPIPTINSYNTVTICGFIKPLSLSFGMFLGFTDYDVFAYSNSLGYNSAQGNVIGISSATVTSLGLLGNWRYYAFVMNKTGLLSTNKIYINAVSQGTLTPQLASDGNIPGFTTNLSLCTWNAGGYYGNIQYGNLQVYNRELTAAEILQNYNALKGRFGL